MVNRIIVLGLMLVGASWGQQTNTVYAQLVSNSQAANVSISIASKYNIGQPYHLLTATLSDAPGKTCSVVQPNPNQSGPFLDMLGGPLASTTLNIITNFSRVINPNSTSNTNRFRMISSAAGAFPLLAANFGSYDNVNCQVSIFYSGGLVGIDVKRYATFGGITDQLRTFSFNAITAGDTTLVAGVPNGKTSVYGLILYNTTAQTIRINDLRIDTVVAPLVILTNYCTGCSLVLPNSNFPLFTTTLGGSIVLNLSVGTAVSGMIMFRVE